MRILKQTKNNNRVSLEIEIDYQQYDEQFQKVIREASQKIKIPGFRPGKAPESIVKQNINIEYAKQQSLDNIVKLLYPEIIKSANIEPVDYPFWKMLSIKDGENCIFLIEVDVMPDVGLGKYIGLKAEKKKIVVDEKEIEDYIKTIQEEGATVKQVARPAIIGDIVELNVYGISDGIEQPKLSQNNLPILLGENRIAPGFDENIVDMNIGEFKEFYLTLPNDYFIKEFSGKNVLFKVEVTKIVERLLPEFNDEYVKRISSFNSVEEYKDNIRKRIEEFKKAKADDELKDKLLEQIIASSKIDLPQGMIRREIDLMVSELEENLSKQGLSLGDYIKSRKIDLATLRNELSVPAQTRVKAKLVLKTIAEKEKIEFTEDDFSSEVKKLSLDLNLPESEVIAKEGIREYIKDYMLRRKALDFIVENAKIEEK